MFCMIDVNCLMYTLVKCIIYTLEYMHNIFYSRCLCMFSKSAVVLNLNENDPHYNNYYIILYYDVLYDIILYYSKHLYCYINYITHFRIYAQQVLL